MNFKPFDLDEAIAHPEKVRHKHYPDKRCVSLTTDDKYIYIAWHDKTFLSTKNRSIAYEKLQLIDVQEPKDNDGWIMVSDYEPLVKTNIFFVTTNGEIHLGFRSALDYQYNSHFDNTAYRSEQVIKWQYVKFPKI